MFLVLTSEEVLVRVAPAGDVFDGDHQTAARAAARPTGRGLTPEEGLVYYFDLQAKESHFIW